MRISPVPTAGLEESRQGRGRPRLSVRFPECTYIVMIEEGRKGGKLDSCHAAAGGYSYPPPPHVMPEDAGKHALIYR
jgi:hypothetical protein